jgi:hypothetical protein
MYVRTEPPNGVTDENCRFTREKVSSNINLLICKAGWIQSLAIFIAISFQSQPRPSCFTYLFLIDDIF